MDPRDYIVAAIAALVRAHTEQDDKYTAKMLKCAIRDAMFALNEPEYNPWRWK